MINLNTKEYNSKRSQIRGGKKTFLFSATIANMKDKNPRKVTKNPIFPLCSKAIAVRKFMDQIPASTLRFPQGNVKENVNFN